jgi:hypothetical protein
MVADFAEGFIPLSILANLKAKEGSMPLTIEKYVIIRCNMITPH